MDEAVESTEARPERGGSVAAWATRTDVLTFALVAFVLVLVAIRIWVSRKIVTPWIMSDEFLYSELARSFASGDGILVREASFPIYNVGYPLLVSPAWLAGSMARTYELAKALNVMLMTTALIPVYFWSRRLMRPIYAVGATALVALIPAFVFTGMLMTENAALPAMVLAFFVIALMLERPTLWYQALALASVGLACLMRTQAIVLAAVLPVAVLVKLVLDARAAEPGERSRKFVRGWRPYLPLVVVYAVGAVGIVLVQAARGVSPNTILGAYSGVTTAHYSLNDVAGWTVEHVAELGLAVAIFPVSALIVLFALALGRGTESAAERAFLAVASSAVVLVVVQVAIFASRYSMRIEERYMFYVVPLLFIALALWLDRGLPRPIVPTAIGTVAPVALLLALPLGERLNISILPTTFAFIPLMRLSTHVSISTVRLLMIVGGIVAAASFAFLPRRLARVVLPSTLALYLALSSVQVFRSIRDYDLSLRASVVPAQLDWVDERLPDGASTGVVFGSTADPFGEEQRLWQAEFWNRDVKRVYELQPEPVSFAKTPISVDPLGAKLVPQDHKPYPYRYVLAANGVSLVGKVIAQHPPWTLYEVRDPLRLTRVTTGLYIDAWMGAVASRTQRTGTAGRLPITISRAGWGGRDVPGHVTVLVGRPVLGAGGQAELQSELRRTFVIHRRQTRTLRVPVPKPPYRVEIHIDPTFSPADFGLADTRQLGAQVQFGRAPGTR